MSARNDTNSLGALPCPWCESINLELIQSQAKPLGVFVQCFDCYARGPAINQAIQTERSHVWREAVRAWNDRPWERDAT